MKGIRIRSVLVATLLAASVAAGLASSAFALTVVGVVSTGTATVVCKFNSQTNTFTFTATNTSAITLPGSTASITGIGFDLPPGGNTSASGLNGFTGAQAPSLSSQFAFSDAALGRVPGLPSAVLDFGFVTGPSGRYTAGKVADGLLTGRACSAERGLNDGFLTTCPCG